MDDNRVTVEELMGGASAGGLRVDFVVREMGDGSVPDEQLRFVRFGDDVSAAGLRDFLDKCRDALCTMFGAAGACVVQLDDPGSSKIWIIKILRDATGCGLRECKEAVEAGPGLAVAAFKSAALAMAFSQRLNAAGAQSRIRALVRNDVVNRPTGAMPLLWCDKSTP